MATTIATTTENSTATIIATADIQTFFEQQNILVVNPTIKRTKENKVPFLTFLAEGENKEDKAVSHNIYFSENAAKLIEEGEQFDEDTFDLKYEMKYIEDSETGEQYIKIGSKGSSVYRAVRRRK